MVTPHFFFFNAQDTISEVSKVDLRLTAPFSTVANHSCIYIQWAEKQLPKDVLMLETCKCYITWQKGIKISGKIMVTNYKHFQWGSYPGLFSWI